MRRRQDPPQITITYVDEKADLDWVTSMLVRSSQRVAVPPRIARTRPALVNKLTSPMPRQLGYRTTHKPFLPEPRMTDQHARAARPALQDRTRTAAS